MKSIPVLRCRARCPTGICWYVGILCLIAAGWEPAEAGDGFLARRARVRRERATLRAEAQEDYLKRAKSAATLVGELIDLAAAKRVPGQEQDLRQLIQALERMAPDLTRPLGQRVDQFPPPPDPVPADARASWERELKRQREKIVLRPGELLNRAVDMGITDLAYDFLQEILSFDPDRAQLRAKLGQTRFQGTWYDPFDLVRATQGITWDHRLGWVLSARKDAYDEGRYYELDQSQWTTSPKDGPFRLDPRAWTALKEANARHSRLATPWLIRTRHIEIRGTADLDRLVEMANRLEQFYDQIFAAYAAFFTRGKSDFKLILGLAEHPPLVVHCYRSKEDYAAAVGDDLAWTAGLFNPSRRASFFYGHPGSVMYHEFTHQILHVFTNGNRSPAWLTEGIAVYTDAPSFSGGKLILGDLRSNPRVLAHLELARAGKALPFAEIVDLRAYSTWQEKAKAGLPVYEAAGALVTFCMEADDRAHRADFVDFLRDNYEGHPDAQTHSLWEYLGTDRDRLSQSFQNWMRGVSGDRTRPQDGSRPQPR